MLATRKNKPDGGTWQTINGTETAFTTAPIGKCVLLCVVKFAMLDPAGMGVEMEAGKPGWNDAMNGLPGMIGSGMPETFELLRMLRFTRAAVHKAGRAVELWAELDALMSAALAALEAFDADDDGAAFTCWDATRTALEEYREATAVYFAGARKTWSAAKLVAALDAFTLKVEAGVEKAVALNGGEIAPTYFAYPAASYELTGEVEEAETARSYVKVTSFGEPELMPNFLEGPVRHLKVIKDLASRKAVFEAVKGSELYDEELKQYLISGTLSGVVGNDVGRMVAFSPGWPENQSIWLHMSYKYYLELLRGGLFADFWEEIKTGLTPFMDPKIYARSPLECASFIASSYHMDKSIHGTGFLARLSGSTAEFLSMCTPRDDVRPPAVRRRRRVGRARAQARARAAGVALRRRRQGELHLPRPRHGHVPQLRARRHVGGDDQLAHAHLRRRQHDVCRRRADRRAVRRGRALAHRRHGDRRHPHAVERERPQGLVSTATRKRMAR